MAAACCSSSRAGAREPREWALFDPDLSKRRSGWSLGVAELAQGADSKSERGLTLEVWGSLRTARGLVFSELRQSVVLRGFEGSTFMAGVSQALHAGVDVGAVELATGGGLTPIGIDVSSGQLSLQLLSPEASMRLGLEIGPVLLTCRGYVQYLARLFGRDDGVIRGLTLDIGLVRRPSHALVRPVERYRL